MPLRRKIQFAKDTLSITMAEVDKEDPDESVRKWRAAGRFYAKQAQELMLDAADDEGTVDATDEHHVRRMCDVSALTGLATMYFAMAHDVDCFGKLPPAAHAADDGE
ncbi:hypothetical protein FGG44_gp45 [Mycobacterium phage MacnCheese]|uniref:Uncharacterized protein n=1 Tax=Mycobacterium phage MacnCheese TaxID=2927982 RepID=I6WIK5_9CAUD|nr:hypothetical protein FGG44_gp45 [Mycobacterium phage MacnCheese]AFN37738.1 hypothetical protein MACNCHEESE_45 [Mycobacterium phage MacnCheese]